MPFKLLPNREKAAQEISTASLPDIVFMLLFFFMVTTVMKDETSKLEIHKPSAEQVEKIEQRDLVASILVGKDEQHIPRIQVDDRFVEVADIGRIVAEKRAGLPEYMRPKFMTVIKADKDMPMGVITDIKQELRKVQAFKIQYSTEEHGAK